MAKSKEQKQLEAKFREVRGTLVDVYREVQSKHIYIYEILYMNYFKPT